MTRSEILEKTIEIAAETLSADAEGITEETTLEELEADSLDAIEIITALEEEFGITFDDDQLETLDSLSSLVNAIENLV